MRDYIWPIILTIALLWFVWACYRDWKIHKKEKAERKEYFKIHVNGYGKYSITRYPEDFLGWGIKLPGQYDTLELAEARIAHIKERKIKSVDKFVKIVE